MAHCQQDRSLAKGVWERAHEGSHRLVRQHTGHTDWCALADSSWSPTLALLERANVFAPLFLGADTQGFGGRKTAQQRSTTWMRAAVQGLEPTLVCSGGAAQNAIHCRNERHLSAFCVCDWAVAA